MDAKLIRSPGVDLQQGVGRGRLLACSLGKPLRHHKGPRLNGLFNLMNNAEMNSQKITAFWTHLHWLGTLAQQGSFTAAAARLWATAAVNLRAAGEIAVEEAAVPLKRPLRATSTESVIVVRLRGLRCLSV